MFKHLMLSLSLTLSICAPAYAQDNHVICLEGECMETEYVEDEYTKFSREVLPWVAEQADLKYDPQIHEIPKFVLYPNEVLQREFYGDMYEIYKNSDETTMTDILALYDWERNIVLLNETEVLNRDIMETIVVHELVHFLQIMNDYKNAHLKNMPPQQESACLEAHANGVMDDFLLDKGLAYDDIGINGLFIRSVVMYCQMPF